MKPSKTLFFLCILVAVLSIGYAGAGLLVTGGEGPFTITSVHGDPVEIYGQGLYRSDSAFKAPILRGTDAVTLLISVPLLLLAAALDWRASRSGRGSGSLRTRIFLTSMLGYFIYNSASLALGAAYNNLLLVYIACFSASFFAFVMAFSSIDLPTLAAQTSARMPHRLVAGFLFLAGMSLIVWIADILSALAKNTVPAHLGHYTTEATYTIDLGILLPGVILAGVLVWRRKPLGTLLAAILITLNMLIGLVVASQSVLQALEGIRLTAGEFAAFVAPFVTLSLIAAVLILSIYRHIGRPVNRKA